MSRMQQVQHITISNVLLSSYLLRQKIRCLHLLLIYACCENTLYFDEMRCPLCTRPKSVVTAGNRHKQNSWFCKEIREDNFRFWWRRVHEDASQGMYMSNIEIFFFTARILQNQRMLCCGECFHDQKHVQFIFVYEV